ncbi:hydantoinase/oxoprolinase family protein [Amycolatopsis acidiphila]|uniref:Hydantoinase/oxoprolinase family protein n=1 Tax=Amycolatopsis acidiphila TaxID=715473 RepID=A0A557ZSH5_9PSEU|nr:hydantoinase/oxoprolinase family protein [Amycolatopsis acidiphila]TVT14986.1 hydantoinase/oxoprolinase family protein [Amycolatopsis acidiphila]UIJ62920.1 hydantoinase/oxoprolinase family protein [Amycolatopsis acidiphila]GHG65062.1 5-oxoprolinase [Amycolatopsis acidiphila]
MTKTSRLAIDVGGTFTDVVELLPATGELRFDKVATTPESPTTGVLDAFAVTGAEVGGIALFTHGTTLGLNALLTRTGARTAVLGTRGFRDVYLLGRTDRRVNYDITHRPPEPLLERYDTFEVTERSLFDGSVHTPLDERDARRVAAVIAERGYQSVAVAFLHAYANPAHELRMREVLAEVAPGVAVTLSHELSREYREYERTSTAVLDAYVKPIVRRYLADLEVELAGRGFGGRFLMTRSGGGAMTVGTAREQPVSLILSGPAGGVIGAAAFAALIGEPNLITVDMGGTSLDASLILDGEPVLHQGAEFEGLPINTPSLYIHTIGAGGGSVAYLDEAGALQVGPRSAGAAPGPASYGRGGTAPTFTDAALALGYLAADVPLGGKLVLDRGLAEKALSPVAQRLGLSVSALARGIVRISSTKIMGAVRAITVEVGRDPKDFALLSFGGGGGLVAVDVAAELGIPTVIVPPGQGAFSAFGMLMADVQHDFSRTLVSSLAELDPADVEAAYAQMAGEAARTLEAEGFAASMSRSLDVRYAGQEHSVTVPFAGLSTVEEAFARLHERQYGHTMTDPVEVTTLRLRATGAVDKPSLPLLASRTSGVPEADGSRPVYVSEEQPAVPYALYTREVLLAGDEFDGPAVIAEHTATTVIHADDHLRVGPHGELVITVGAA